jgi:hypothetical protein
VAATGNPFKRARRGEGDGPWEAPCGGDEWGGVWGLAQQSGGAVCTAARARGWRVTGAEIGEAGDCQVGPWYSNWR